MVNTKNTLPVSDFGVCSAVCSAVYSAVCIQAGLGKISKKTAALYDTRENDSDDEFFHRAAWEPGMWTWQTWQSP